ncbi:hypothetical protein [Flavobacterium sp.]
MNPITSFWNHFQQNNFVFLLINEIPKTELKKHFNILLRHLHNYNEDLNLIIIYKKNTAQVVITANGNPYLFKEVELLVHHAPKIDRWKITAFLQPETSILKYKNGTDKPLDYYGISIKISDMYFQPIKNPQIPTQMGIKVFLKNYIVHKHDPKLKEAVYVHIEHLVGEKAFANEIAFIEIAQLEGEQKNLTELYNLKQYLDKKNYN